MGFVPPANLPDYSKLLFMLNSSGAQAWNPAVYDILKQLIGAVQQSQNVVSDNISNIPSASSGLSSVSVDPAGALSGNGTPGTPLAVKVDNSTIIINGSNQLQSTTVPLIFSASGGGSLATVAGGVSNQPFAAKTPFGSIPAVPGKTIWPIAVYVTGGQTITNAGGAWNTTATWEVVWNGITGPLIGGSGNIFTTSFSTSSFTGLYPSPNSQLVISGSAFKNTDLIIRTSNAGTILGSTFAAPATLENHATWTILYILI